MSRKGRRVVRASSAASVELARKRYQHSQSRAIRVLGELRRSSDVSLRAYDGDLSNQALTLTEAANIFLVRARILAGLSKDLADLAERVAKDAEDYEGKLATLGVRSAVLQRWGKA